MINNNITGTSHNKDANIDALNMKSDKLTAKIAQYKANGMGIDKNETKSIQKLAHQILELHSKITENDKSPALTQRVEPGKMAALEALSLVYEAKCLMPDIDNRLSEMKEDLEKLKQAPNDKEMRKSLKDLTNKAEKLEKIRSRS